MSIQNKMHKATELVERANGLMSEVEEYLESQGVSYETCYYDGPVSLNDIANGDDVTGSFRSSYRYMRNMWLPDY